MNQFYWGFLIFFKIKKIVINLVLVCCFLVLFSFCFLDIMYSVDAGYSSISTHAASALVCRDAEPSSSLEAHNRTFCIQYRGQALYSSAVDA